MTWSNITVMSHGNMSLAHVTVVCVTVSFVCFLQDEPFIMKAVAGNRTIWSGFLIDLLQKMASDLNFAYEIYEDPDKAYGIKTNGQWSGIIKQLSTRVHTHSLHALCAPGVRFLKKLTTVRRRKAHKVNIELRLGLHLRFFKKRAPVPLHSPRALRTAYSALSKHLMSGYEFA